VANHEAPHIPALPKAFEHYRYELGAEVYGSVGITVADPARHAAAVMRNFDFFGASLGGIVCLFPWQASSACIATFVRLTLSLWA